MPADDGAVTPGWRLLHIGFEGDEVSVAGINPWKVVNWSSTGETIIVAHPSYPAQRHTMRVYVLDPDQGGPCSPLGSSRRRGGASMSLWS